MTTTETCACGTYLAGDPRCGGTAVEDACGYGRLDPADQVSLACDYSGMYAAHQSGDEASWWSAETLAALNAVTSVAELRALWGPLEQAGEVDGFGGAEYHHALAHLRHKLNSVDPSADPWAGRPAAVTADVRTGSARELATDVAMTVASYILLAELMGELRLAGIMQDAVDELGRFAAEEAQ